MNLENLKTFLTIVETKSLSKTANVLYLSQSTISHRLKQLEKELETKLIQRNRGEREVTLTLEGEDFVELAKKWVLLWEETTRWKEKDFRLKIKIGCSDSLNTCVFPPLYKLLMKNNSLLTIKVRSHWSTVIIKLVENYELDFGLVLMPVNNNNVIIEPLFDERFVVVSFKEKGLQDTVHPKDLDPKNEIYFYHGPEYKIWHNYWWDPATINRSTVDTASLLLSIFDSPNYWAIVPMSMARLFKENIDIKISELSKPAPNRICYKVKHRMPKKTALPSIEIFEEKLHEYIESNTMKKLIE
ncbi:LysR family transcriptional regulator [Maledivibacter halophilus]|uniref:DNA-binding transcriptional regulator, LysR family n=1 Tax=Maledivibacter halophilus TaxID=36842 RepID=A0A1T5IN18_9FIRM|nr:LysR family transcriptional regulator [Maledivibacter halophilus]SKC40566.1 DNA-binding transcriptional regulator, LysR family [Maledivibacter halophilus]